MKNKFPYNSCPTKITRNWALGKCFSLAYNLLARPVYHTTGNHSEGWKGICKTTSKVISKSFNNTYFFVPTSRSTNQWPHKKCQYIIFLLLVNFFWTPYLPVINILRTLYIDCINFQWSHSHFYDRHFNYCNY